MNKILILGIFLSGGDHLALQISGMTFRFSQFLFLIYFLLTMGLFKYKINKNITIAYGFIFIPHFISLLYTKSFTSSLAYLIFIVFNYIIVIIPIINWCSNKKNEEIIKIYIKIFRGVGILTIFQFLLGTFGIFIPIFQNDSYKGIFRPSLWFYEPSYLATYFSLYIGVSLVGYIYNKKIYRKDLLFSWLCTALTTSSTGFIAIGLSMIFLILLEKSLKNKIKSLYSILVFGGLIILVIGLIKIDILKVFLGRLFSQGIQESSGLRIIGVWEAVEIFKRFPIFGLGANAYEKYHATGLPVTNVSLEILTNLGIVGFISFFCFFFYLFKLYKLNKENIEVKMMWVALLLFLIILQANQNYMRLYMWIHIGLYIGILNNEKNGEKNANISDNS